MPLIPLDLIDVPDRAIRHVPASAAEEAGLRASIEAVGLLTPVLLRESGNRYVLVDGRRRLAVARALAFAQIAAHVEVRPEAQAAAMSAATNMVRAPMAPTDQWAAMRQLRDDGYTLSGAAAALGLTERRARQLEKLGALHPDLLARIAAGDMPRERELGIIASAPAEVQANAVKALLSDIGETDWHTVAARCDMSTIPRSRAIFDVDASTVVFEEDLFAPADAPDREFTTDVAGFLAAQEAALRADIAAAKAKRKRVEMAATDKNSAVKLPKGWIESYGNPDKPKKDETVFRAIVKSGYAVGGVIAVTARKAGGAADDAAPAPEEDVDDAPAPRAKRDAKPPAAPDESAEAQDREPITVAGREVIARVKTEALLERLATAPPATDLLLGCLVLALGAHTVEVRVGVGWNRKVRMTDLAASLVPPEGAASLMLDNVREVAIEALGRLLACPGPHQPADPVPDWVGHALGADAALPRFDTAEFLAHVTGPELRRIAAEAGLRPAKSVAALREQLAGRLPQWRPTAAQFGAPGPAKGGS